MMLETIMAIEKSTVANAGLGCNLTHSGTAELESSFASVSREASCYGSVAAVDYTEAGLEMPVPSQLAYSLSRRQYDYLQEQAALLRPPLLLCGVNAFGNLLQQNDHHQQLKGEGAYVTPEKLKTLQKKAVKSK